MNRYDVTVHYVQNRVVTVEAENEDQARELAKADVLELTNLPADEVQAVEVTVRP